MWLYVAVFMWPLINGELALNEHYRVEIPLLADGFCRVTNLTLPPFSFDSFSCRLDVNGGARYYQPDPGVMIQLSGVAPAMDVTDSDGVTAPWPMVQQPGFTWQVYARVLNDPPQIPINMQGRIRTLLSTANSTASNWTAAEPTNGFWVGCDSAGDWLVVWSTFALGARTSNENETGTRVEWRTGVSCALSTGWTHVTLTFDAFTKRASLFLNASLVYEEILNYQPSSLPLRLASATDAPAENHWVGLVYELVYDSVALTAEELAVQRNQRYPGNLYAVEWMLLRDADCVVRGVDDADWGPFIGAANPGLAALSRGVPAPFACQGLFPYGGVEPGGGVNVTSAMLVNPTFNTWGFNPVALYTKQFTVSAWVYFNGEGSRLRRILGNFGDGQWGWLFACLQLDPPNQNTSQWYLQWGDGTSAMYWLSGIDCAPNAWTHLALTYLPKYPLGGVATLFVNGIPTNTGEFSFALCWLPLQIGTVDGQAVGKVAGMVFQNYYMNDAQLMQQLMCATNPFPPIGQTHRCLLPSTGVAAELTTGQIAAIVLPISVLLMLLLWVVNRRLARKASSNSERQRLIPADPKGPHDQEDVLEEQQRLEELLLQSPHRRKELEAEREERSPVADTAEADARSLVELRQHPSVEITCRVCKDAPIDRAILPCEHLCMCHECALDASQCPVCRGPIHALVPVNFT